MTKKNAKKKIFIFLTSLSLIILAGYVIIFGNQLRKDGYRFEECIRKSDLKCIDQLIKKDKNLDFYISKGWTPLTFSASEGKLDVAIHLIQHGANINKLADGLSAIYWAAFNNDIPMIKYFLDIGADACLIKDGSNLTPKRVALQQGFLDAAAALPECTEN